MDRYARVALLVAGTYLVLSAGALSACRWLVPRLLPLQRGGSLAQGLGDGLFVLLTAGLLFLVVERAGRVITTSQRTVRASAVGLRAAHDAFEALVGGSPLAIVGLDRDGVVASWNPAAERMLGCSATETVGRPLASVIDTTADALRDVLASLLGGDTVRGRLLAARRRDGAALDLSLSAAPLRSSSTEAVAGAIVVLEDVTERWLLHEFDAHVLRGGALEAGLRFLCERVAALYGLALVQISVKGAEGVIDVRAYAGPAAGFLEGARVRWDATPEGQGPTGRAIRSGRVATVDVARDPGFEPWRTRALDFGLRGGIALPLTAKGETLGALTCYVTHAEPLDDATQAGLRALADRVALSLLAAVDQAQIRLQTAALEAAANAVVITDRAGVIRWTNPAFARLTGYACDEALGRTPRLLKSGVHSEAFYRQMWEAVLAGQVWRGELYNRRKDGSVYVEEQTITPLRDDSGAVAHFVAVKQDISDRKRQEERIRYLAMHDALTDLPNRRSLAESLARVVERARRGPPSALLIADLDHFKLVNDTFGHLAGDRVLIAVAGLLEHALRPSDLLARVGGDEFAVVLEDVSLDEARWTAERVRRTVDEARLEFEQHPLDLGVSVGVAPVDGRLAAEAVLALADAALYAAKDQGRNRCVVYSDARDGAARLAEAGRWAACIKDALEAGRFVLHFQPVVRLADGQVEHFEALLRMRAPGGDALVLPAQFLDAAERFGLMPQIDRWVLDEVLRVCASRPCLKVFVNLSGASFADAALLEYIEQRVRAASLAPGRIVFEVTESAAVADLSRAQHWIRRLKDLGCLFALDDFGLGLSSFSYLQALPADYVKIDASFVRNVDTDLTSRALVRAIMGVAHALGKEVIAEAVETHGVAVALRALAVERGQGYFLGAPGPEIEAMSARRDDAGAGSSDTGSTAAR